MGRNSFLLLCVFVLTVITASAQENRYMVFFRDKAKSPFNIRNPEEYLSQRAIERRLKQKIQINNQDLPVSNQYIESLRKIEGVSVFFESKWFNGVLIEADQSLIPTIEALSNVKNVEFVAPGKRLNSFSARVSLPDREVIEEVTNITNALQNNMLGIDEMHELGYTGSGILLAVFDAGFIGTNFSPYFSRIYDQEKILAAYDFVENGKDIYKYDDHGTSVLSTISAYYEDVYIGTAPDVDLILCVTEDYPTEYRIEEYNWVFAAEYADSIGVDIINTSLGYNKFSVPYDAEMDYTIEDMDGNTTVITKATDIAASKGILCVVSAGNEGSNSWGRLVAPADADTVLSVGAVDEALQHSSFSSIGPTADNRIKPEVSALGVGTKLIGWDGLLTSGKGTSYAAPLIAGLAAGVWQAFPDLNNVELIELIKQGSSQYLNPDNMLGYGVPDFREILSDITSLEDDLPDDKFKVYPNPVKNHRLYVEVIEKADYLNIDIIDLSGKKVFEYYTDRQIGNVRHELDLKAIPTGIYILNISSGPNLGKVKLLIP